jgi:hypothetical protein
MGKLGFFGEWFVVSGAELVSCILRSLTMATKEGLFTPAQTQTAPSGHAINA